MNQHVTRQAAGWHDHHGGARGVTIRYVRDGTPSDLMVPLTPAPGAEGGEPTVGQLVALAPQFVAVAMAQAGDARTLRIAGAGYEEPGAETVPFRTCYCDGEGNPYVVDVAAQTAAGAMFHAFWNHASSMARPETDQAGFLAWLASLTPVVAIELPRHAPVPGSTGEAGR